MPFVLENRGANHVRIVYKIQGASRGTPGADFLEAVGKTLTRGAASVQVDLSEGKSVIDLLVDHLISLQEMVTNNGQTVSLIGHGLSSESAAFLKLTACGIQVSAELVRPMPAIETALRDSNVPLPAYEEIKEAFEKLHEELKKVYLKKAEIREENAFYRGRLNQIKKSLGADSQSLVIFDQWQEEMARNQELDEKLQAAQAKLDETRLVVREFKSAHEEAVSETFRQLEDLRIKYEGELKALDSLMSKSRKS